MKNLDLNELFRDKRPQELEKLLMELYKSRTDLRELDPLFLEEYKRMKRLEDSNKILSELGRLPMPSRKVKIGRISYDEYLRMHRKKTSRIPLYLRRASGPLALLLLLLWLIHGHKRENPNYVNQTKQEIVKLVPIAEPPYNLKEMGNGDGTVSNPPTFYQTEVLGYNPHGTLGQTTQSTNPDRQLADYTETRLRYGYVIEELKSNLEHLINTKNDPTELYTHTFKKGDRNTYSYANFFQAYFGAFLRHADLKEILPELEKNKNVEHIIYLSFTIQNDGTLTMSKFVDSLLQDPSKKIIRHYDELLKDRPTKFVPPSKANLPVPFSIYLALRNEAADCFCDNNKTDTYHPTKDGRVKLENRIAKLRPWNID